MGVLLAFRTCCRVSELHPDAVGTIPLHLPVFYGWLVRCPDLRGTWRAELDSSWIDFATETHAPTIRCYVAITQTATKLQLRLMTGESESWVLASGIRVSEKGPGYQVTGVYLNQPDSQLRGARSEMHFGAFVLDTHGSAQRPSSMKGEYWTDRGTKGSLHLTSHVGAILTSFDEADARLG